MKEIDARGLICPQPVLMAKKAVAEGASEITVIVDNQSSADNVARFAKSAGCSSEITKSGDDFNIIIRKTGDTDLSNAEITCDVDKLKLIKDKVLLVSTDSLGRDDRELGALLIKVLLNALAENDVLPEKIIFMNAGVKLCCEGSESLDALKQIYGQGVEIMACGTCLKHFNIADKIQIGNISNAYEIMNALLKGNIIPWA